MPIDTHPKRKPPTPEEVIAEQKRQANASRQQQQGRPSRHVDKVAPPASVPATVTTAAPATLATDTRTPEEKYIDEIAPSAIAGQLVKFSKEGKFVIAETEDEISVTSSQTGRRAVGNLLRHFDRMRRTDAESYPVVRLKPSGFQHKDERVGWVHTPKFAVVGRTPKSAAAMPDTSVAGDMSDQIPF
jgi:hypothetical protein